MDIPPPAGSILPPQIPAFNGVIGRTYKESKSDWPQRQLPPADAPHIVASRAEFRHGSLYDRIERTLREPLSDAEKATSWASTIPEWSQITQAPECCIASACCTAQFPANRQTTIDYGLVLIAATPGTVFATSQNR